MRREGGRENSGGVRAEGLHGCQIIFQVPQVHDGVGVFIDGGDEVDRGGGVPHGRGASSGGQRVHKMKRGALGTQIPDPERELEKKITHVFLQKCQK